jgi:hypothetical protein
VNTRAIMRLNILNSNVSDVVKILCEWQPQGTKKLLFGLLVIIYSAQTVLFSHIYPILLALSHVSQMTQSSHHFMKPTTLLPSYSRNSDWLKGLGSIHIRSKRFFSVLQHPDRPRGTASLFSTGYPRLCPWGKAAGT